MNSSLKKIGKSISLILMSVLRSLLLINIEPINNKLTTRVQVRSIV